MFIQFLYSAIPIPCHSLLFFCSGPQGKCRLWGDSWVLRSRGISHVQGWHYSSSRCIELGVANGHGAKWSRSDECWGYHGRRLPTSGQALPPFALLTSKKVVDFLSFQCCTSLSYRWPKSCVLQGFWRWFKIILYSQNFTIHSPECLCYLIFLSRTG